jgi:hypothetical protein
MRTWKILLAVLLGPLLALLVAAPALAASPTITANVAVARTGPNSAVVTGEFTCEAGSTATISATTHQVSANGNPISAKGFTGTLTCTGLLQTWSVTVIGSLVNGPGTVTAVINQLGPAATARYDGPIVVA